MTPESLFPAYLKAALEFIASNDGAHADASGAKFMIVPHATLPLKSVTAGAWITFTVE